MALLLGAIAKHFAITFTVLLLLPATASAMTLMQNSSDTQSKLFSSNELNTIIIFITLLALVVVFLCFVIFRLSRANQTVSDTYAAKSKAYREQELTHKRLAEEIKANKSLSGLLHNIFDSSLHGIIAFTSIRNKKNHITDFNFQMANAVAAKITHRDVSELQGNTMLTLFPGNKETGLFDEYVKVVISGKPYQTIVYYCHDEIETWFSISAVKNLDGLIVTFSDISGLKKQEQDLIKKQKALEEANNELEQFAYIASHDLQEPLRKIRAFGDRLESNYSDIIDDKGKDFIARMRNASARMQVLIDDLLKFSRATRSHTEKAQIDLNQVVKVVQEFMGESIKETHANIKIASLPTVYANESQMIQLFQNLLSNALKYVKENTVPDVNISVDEVIKRVENEDISFWQISVKDQGIGFDAAYKDKIFNIFQRLHGRSEFKGTGIGLAICLKIVSNHNGFIFADSKVGEGANFVVLLPKSIG